MKTQARYIDGTALGLMIVVIASGLLSIGLVAASWLAEMIDDGSFVWFTLIGWSWQSCQACIAATVIFLFVTWRH